MLLGHTDQLLHRTTASRLREVAASSNTYKQAQTSKMMFQSKEQGASPEKDLNSLPEKRVQSNGNKDAHQSWEKNGGTQRELQQREKITRKYQTEVIIELKCTPEGFIQQQNG